MSATKDCLEGRDQHERHEIRTRSMVFFFFLRCRMKYQVLEGYPEVLTEAYFAAKRYLVEYVRLWVSGGQCESGHKRVRQEVADVLEAALHQSTRVPVPPDVESPLPPRLPLGSRRG